MWMSVLVLVVAVLMGKAAGQCLTDNDNVQPIFLPFHINTKAAQESSPPPQDSTTTQDPPTLSQSAHALSQPSPLFIVIPTPTQDTQILPQNSLVPSQPTPTPTVKSTVPSYNLSMTIPFAVNLFKDLVARRPSNLLLSPLSVWAGAGLAGLGAGKEGKVLGQLLGALGVKDKTHLLATYRAIHEMYGSGVVTGTGVERSDLVTRVYLDKIAQVRPCVAEVLHPHLMPLDFSQVQATTSTINQFVNHSTQGHIPKVVGLGDVLGARGGLILVNAAYMRGEWQQPFQPALPRPFRLEGGSEVRVKMMTKQGAFRITNSSELGATMVELPYKGGRFAMYILLPYADNPQLVTNPQPTNSTQPPTNRQPANNTQPTNSTQPATSRQPANNTQPTNSTQPATSRQPANNTQPTNSTQQPTNLKLSNQASTNGDSIINPRQEATKSHIDTEPLTEATLPETRRLSWRSIQDAPIEPHPDDLPSRPGSSLADTQPDQEVKPASGQVPIVANARIDKLPTTNSAADLTDTSVHQPIRNADNQANTTTDSANNTTTESVRTTANATDTANTTTNSTATTANTTSDSARTTANATDAANTTSDSARTTDNTTDTANTTRTTATIPSLDNVVKRLSERNLRAALSSLQHQEVQVSLPVFTLSSSLSHHLVQALAGLGITNADLTAFSPGGGLRARTWRHKAAIEVNEKGSEAAAATTILVGLSAHPPPVLFFTCDRPFIFLIRDNVNNDILFMGAFRDPPTP